MSFLNLTVGVVAGSDINDVFEQASRLAWRLSLAWINFDFNGDKCTAYPDGRGHVYRGCNTVGMWTNEKGIQWK